MASATISIDVRPCLHLLRELADACLTESQMERLAELLDCPSRMIRFEHVGCGENIVYASHELMDLWREVRDCGGL